MKKTCLLNSKISSVISKMGHTDMIAIGDCGLPIPKESKRIDLALTKGIPSFLDTLKVTLTELKVEEIIIAKETKDVSPYIFSEIENLVGDVKITFVSHENFKMNLKECKAIIRTGEQTPYANIILKSGVVF
ncbi:D-ribose pyranase [Candidatus Arthromitus sp. SFB-rat-Yit]|uniref:D-ribose pyranase n=1 Tax=Candidatus Arthromitus sp. SFB-rat-Yit TaxID=1041504 RepID=UPI000227A091|nr:D-ribose pyranase [Candidatus Arthromitus sp. SFB-rat-Yit]BAK81822.1 D-ribose pyranase [Candidatus Arthromitus sp. SFB-rat-Yit]